MITRIFSNIHKEIPRVKKDHWISFVYDLSSVPCLRGTTAASLRLRLATEEDLDVIAHHGEGKEPVVVSSLRFWREYGFRKLYLGILENDQEPAIMQYVFDESDNDRYPSMTYGNIYRRQNSDSVMVENIYAFRSKRQKHLAAAFEARLFEQLKQMGKREVRTHVNIKNTASLFWARAVGFRPDSWITMVTIDLPFLRSLKRKFLYSPVQQADYDTYPLSMFKG